MADIFISYAREDKERVRLIVEELERLGWSVFWDTHLRAGDDWRRLIELKLDESSCVLVVWSHYSITSKWVLKEAAEGEKRDILVPLLLDAVEPPFGFRDIHAEDFIDWKINSSSQAFKEIIGVIESKISVSKQPIASQATVWGSKVSLSKKIVKQAVIAFTVFTTIILGVIWVISNNQEKLLKKPVPNVLLAPDVFSDTAVVNKKQEIHALQQEEAATRKAKKEATARPKLLQNNEDRNLDTSKTHHPVPDISILSKWVGNWHSGRGSLFSFVMHLKIKSDDTVDGYILWRLLKLPPNSPITSDRINEPGTEFVRGSIDRNTREVSLSGYRTDNPTLLGLDTYRFFISADGHTFRGLSQDADGSWYTSIEGTVGIEAN